MVTLSPYGVAPLCCGGQLELMCTTRTGLLEWRFTINNRATTGRLSHLTHYILSTGSTEDNRAQLIVSSTLFNFSRISDENSSPLVTRLLIGPVSVGLNGTEMICVDMESYNSSTLTILSTTECQYPGTHKLHCKIFMYD